jgi:CBS domain-containing protein
MIDRTPSIVADPDISFLEVLRRFAKHASARGVFVVDGNRRLVGVLTRQDLLAWACVAFGSEWFVRRFPAARLTRLARAETVGAACRPDSHLTAVRPGEAIDVALADMVAFDLIDVPVVDERGRLVGDLRLTEVVAKAVEIAEDAASVSRG